ncbi:hypothetical protein [Catalinimonas niigatensis]|uniref:hypothetical protein n=1 Tax=Catalinimonas niigatensis TaxID=1397264 RepID=UPI002666D84D|nr:hypothetical protein [Catalinimonas niigatensis]WPP53287.1 hypothetical protein PZB72_12980 [Catalinimonas niigatensis]
MPIETNFPTPGYAFAMHHVLKAFTLVLPFMIAACEGGKRKEISEEEAKFTTSDASEIFFRNVRSIYYEKTVMDEAKLDVYRLKERLQADGYPLLNLSIVVNWRYDEAYVLTEPNDFLQQMDTIKIMWRDTTQNDSGVFKFSKGNKDDHFRLATQLYRSIQAQRKLYVLHDHQELPFMQRRDAREAFRKTMVDYFRLVDLL